MPYMSETTLTFLNLSRKSLPPQYVGVNPFSDYSVPGKEYVHYVVCCYNPLKKHRFSSSPRDIQIQ